MIIDAYITARHTCFVNITIISNIDSLLSINDNVKNIKLDNPDISYRGLHYYSIKWKHTEPSKQINLIIKQNSDIKKINTSTLIPPEGNKLFSFGILSDLHINRKTTDQLPQSAKRLYSKANFLAEKYVKSIEELNADFIIYPGDIIDSGSFSYLEEARKIITGSKIPYYPIIGNHEEYGEVTRDDFYKAFSLPQEGYYSFTKDNYHFIMLDTPDQSSLNNNANQFRWLKNQLDKFGFSHKIFLFSHFSLLLHPCVEGWRNDGMQQLYNYKEVLDLLKKYPGVKIFFAGHKNVPSKIIKDGIIHMLCPQLIQAPCGFYMINLYEKGLVCTYYEIDEKHFIQVSRNGYGNNWKERIGTEESRNFVLNWQ